MIAIAASLYVVSQTTKQLVHMLGESFSPLLLLLLFIAIYDPLSHFKETKVKSHKNKKIHRHA